MKRLTFLLPLLALVMVGCTAGNPLIQSDQTAVNKLQSQATELSDALKQAAAQLNSVHQAATTQPENASLQAQLQTLTTTVANFTSQQAVMNQALSDATHKLQSDAADIKGAQVQQGTQIATTVAGFTPSPWAEILKALIPLVGAVAGAYVIKGPAKESGQALVDASLKQTTQILDTMAASSRNHASTNQAAIAALHASTPIEKAT